MYNNGIIQVLDELTKIADMMGEVYRAKAYAKAVTEIKKLPYEITIGNISTKIPGIGEGIKNKIIEFLRTGKIEELEKLKSDPKMKSYDVFSKILGVGPAIIKKWHAQKIYTLVDLRKAISTGKVVLTNMQKYGLMYYEDLNTRIPRDEVIQLSEYIKQLIYRLDPKIIFTVCGSFRRGFNTSGDIDILISNEFVFDEKLLLNLIEVLKNDKNFIDTISEGPERVTFLYKSAISEKVRQIDVLNLPYESYWAGVLYFTGDWQFNNIVRGYAKKHGYRLNQKGIYKTIGGKLKLIPVKSEKEIFDILKLQYIEPKDRDAEAIKPKK